MKKYLFIFLPFYLLVFNPVSQGQNPRIDTLFSRIERAEDKDKGALYSNLAYYFIPYSFDKFNEYAFKAIEFADKFNNHSEKAVAYNVLGLGNQRTGRYDTAFMYFTRSLSISEQNHDTANMEISLRNIGYLFLDKGEYYNAYRYFSRDLELAWAVNDSTNIVRGLENIGIYYVKTGNQEKAVECLIRALKITKARNNIKREITLLINLAASLGELDKIDKSKVYLEEALRLAVNINDTASIASINLNLGHFYKNKNSYDSALNCFNKALELYLKIRRANRIVKSYLHRGEVYLLMKDYDQSFNDLNKALDLAEKSGMKIAKASALFNLGKAYYEKKDYNRAISFYSRANLLALSENVKDIVKDTYLALFEVYEKTGDFKTSLKYHKLYTSVKDIIFNEANNEKILELETRYETEKKESEIQLLKKSEEIQAKEISRQKTRTNTILIITGLIIIVGLLIFNRGKLKQKQYSTELEKNNIEIQQRLLRAQMNPHFIFNSLNSIQSYIAANNTFVAMSYLSKFARLMRLILENTRQSYVTLENEINTLELNIELEKIRFKDKYDYKIEAEPSINTEEILIPPMLLQPFVENAIKHGLLKLKKKGMLKISYAVADSLLICNINDNGIGREASAEFNKHHRVQHKSLGMEVTGERINMLKNQTSKDISVIITDLKDENGQACGTNVELRIPFKVDRG